MRGWKVSSITLIALLHCVAMVLALPRPPPAPQEEATALQPPSVPEKKPVDVLAEQMKKLSIDDGENTTSPRN
jgi:hypothetical protein